MTEKIVNLQDMFDADIDQKRFVRNVNANKNHTDQTLEKISNTLKNSWQNGVYKKRRQLTDEEKAIRSAKIREAIKAKWEDGTYRDSDRNAKIKKAWQEGKFDNRKRK